ncbi:MAG: type II toxin-antitoxin system HicB family antitoxin [Propionivibrio sp.]
MALASHGKKMSDLLDFRSFCGCSKKTRCCPLLVGRVWALVPIDLALLSEKTELVNINLPSRVLRRIDAATKAAGEWRSGFIAWRTLAVKPSSFALAPLIEALWLARIAGDESTVACPWLARYSITKPASR